MPSTTTPRLRLVQGQAKHDLVELTGRVTLGRLGTVELPLKDTKASREHARVFEQGGDWHIVDLNSTNGTQVNGAAITRRALRPGDEITIGTTVFVFEMPEPPPPEPAAAPPPKAAEPVVRQRPEPEDSVPEFSPDTIVVKQRSLQFKRVEGGDKTAGVLSEDVGQRGGFYRLLIVLALLAVTVVIFFIVTSVVRSMVASDEDEETDEFEDVRARARYEAIA